MPAILFSAVLAASFGSPLSDAELAAAVTAPAAPLATVTFEPQRWSPFGFASLAGEQMDVWWSEEGMAMIAEAVRPAPTLPGGLNLDALAAGRIDIRMTLTQSTPGR